MKRISKYQIIEWAYIYFPLWLVIVFLGAFLFSLVSCKSLERRKAKQPKMSSILINESDGGQMWYINGPKLGSCKSVDRAKYQQPKSS